jgi:hypothetical protein
MQQIFPYFQKDSLELAGANGLSPDTAGKEPHLKRVY